MPKKLPSYEEQLEIVKHPFKVQLRNGKVISGGRVAVQGVNKPFAVLVIPSDEFGAVTREISWLTLRDIKQRDGTVLI